MTTRHFIHLNARGAVAMRPVRGGLQITGRFGRAADALTAPDGAEALFARWPRDRFVLVVDSVDEELHLDEIPALRGRDRQRMIGRRIAQRFRERRLATGLVMQSNERRPQGWREWIRRGSSRLSLLLAGIPIDTDLQAWTGLARISRARIGGVYSPALLADEVARRIGGSPSGLLLTVQPAGVRQTLLIDGHPRFTRLAIVAGTTIDSRTISGEVSRVIQYLLMNQLISRDLMRERGIGVWLVDDGIADPTALPTDLTVDNASSVAVHRMASSQLGGRAILDEQGAPLAVGDPIWGLALWAQTSLIAGAGAGYANDDIRDVDGGIRLRRQAIGVGAGALATSLLTYGAVMVLEAGNVAGARSSLSRAEIAEGATLRDTMQRWPVSGLEMGQVVEIAGRLRERGADPRRLFGQVARALESDAELRLVSLGWSRTASGGGQPTGSSSGPSPASMGGPGNGLPGLPGGPATGAGPAGPGGATRSSTLEKLPPLGTMPVGPAAGVVPAGGDGRLTVRIRAELPQRVSKAGANQRAEAFAESLARACRCDARVTVPPFNPEPAASFSADLQLEARDAPRFTVELRVGRVGAGLPSTPNGRG